MDINTDIKVSVIMPIYNAYNYLCPALDSVLDQTLEEIEVICVDDGSTDHSLEILKEYQERDSRIRIVTETNAGPGLARNNGIRRARGEYLAFLDADDFFEPTLLETLYGIAKRDDLDIAITRYDLYNTKSARFETTAHADHSDIYSSGKVTSKSEYPDQILSSTVGSAWNKLFRREFVINMGLVFLPEVRMYEDVYFVTTALALAERVGKTGEVLMHHRVHSEQSRARMFRKYHTQIPLVYLKIKEFLVSHGMYAPLSQSFLNLSADRCHKAFNILNNDSKEHYWNLLHSVYLDQLGWVDRRADEFDSDEVCEFVASVQAYEYEEYKRMIEKGKRIRVKGKRHSSDANSRKCAICRFISVFSGKKTK